MSRRYTDFERQLVLRQVIANNYDVALTSIQSGVPESTVLRWRKKYLPSTPPQIHAAASLTISPPLPPLPADEVLAFRDIKRQLMAHIHRLSHSIEDAIDEATLSQRTTALSQLIDRVMRISAQIPPEPEDYLLEDLERQIPDG